MGLNIEKIVRMQQDLTETILPIILLKFMENNIRVN